MATHEQITNVDAQDALQYAKAFLPSIVQKLNKSLDDLRQSENTFTLAAIEQAFSAATMILIDGVADMAMNSATAIGLTSSMMKSTSKGKELSDQLNPLNQENVELERIAQKTPAQRARHLAVKTQIGNLQTDQGKIAATLQNESNLWQAFGHGIGSIPKSMANSLKTQLDAVKQVLDQLSQLTQGTYQKVLDTVRSSLNIELLAGLVALGSLQIR
jgi:hypothetical protein